MSGNARQAKSYSQNPTACFAPLMCWAWALIMILGGGRGLYTLPACLQVNILLPACVQVNAMLEALQAEDEKTLTANEAAQVGTSQAELDSLPAEVDPEVCAVRAGLQ